MSGAYVNTSNDVEFEITTFSDGVATGDLELALPTGVTISGWNGNLSGAISCADASDCVALGSNGDQTYAFTESSGVWATGVALASGEFLGAISCTSSTWCEAVGGDAGDSIAVTDSSGTWSSPTTITPPDYIYAPFGSALDAVSCWAQSDCTVAGFGYSSNNFDFVSFVTTLIDTTWTNEPEIFGIALVTGIACPQQGYCLAVGTESDSEYGSYEADDVVLYDDSWTLSSFASFPSDESTQTNNTGSGWNSVSCVDRSDCVVTGFFNDTNNVIQAMYANTSITSTNVQEKALFLQSPNATTVDPTTTQTSMYSASCADASDCELVGVTVNAQGIWQAAAVSNGTPPPGPVQSVIATSGNASTVVSWSAPVANGGPAPTSYTAYAGTHRCTTTALTCTITGLTNGTSYDVDVQATNSVGPGALSATVIITPVGPPSAPTLMAPIRGNEGATVTWSVPTNDGGGTLSGYDVFVREGTTGQFADTACSNAQSVSTTTCDIVGLKNGEIASIEVRAVNAFGLGVPSNVVTVTPATTPAVPTSVTAIEGDHRITVAWSETTMTALDPTNGGSTIKGFTATAGTQTCATVSTHTCVITELTNGQQYTVTVVATNALGSSAPSSPVVATPSTKRPSGPPSVVRSLKAKATVDTVTLTWRAPLKAGTGIAAYEVYEREINSTGRGYIYVLIASPTLLTYELTGISGNTTYYFEVIALATNGQVSLPAKVSSRT